MVRQDAPAWARWAVPVIVSIAAEDPGTAERIAARLGGVAGVAALEVDLTLRQEGDPGPRTSDLAATVRAAALASGLPILARIAPGTEDPGPLIAAVERGGAQALTVSGAVPALLIDPDRRRSVLAAPSGTLSGPAIRPLAMWIVARVAARTALPIIAAGGVSSGRDVAAFIMAGASAVQVGSVTLREPGAPWRILEEFESWCATHGVAGVAEIQGRTETGD